jgi:YidC/Oxa1 family membrane protein insertase
MEKRYLLAVFLCFLVIYVWQALFVKPQPKPAVPPVSAAGAAGVGATGSRPAAAAPAATPGVVGPPASTALVADTGERDVRIETAYVIAVFTNRGGRLKSWRLKRYTDQRKQPLELVVNDLPPPSPLPFTLRVPDEMVTSTLNGALYAVKESSGDARDSPADVTFEYRDTAGLHAVKQFHLEPKSYILTFRDAVRSGDRALAPSIAWGPGLSDTEVSTRFGYAPRALLSAGGKEQRLAAAAIVKQPGYSDDFKYAGIDDHYFMSVAFEPGRATVTYQPVSIPQAAGSKDPPRALMAYSIAPDPNEPLKFYIGPKDFNELASIDRDFVRAVDFGIWSFIVVPLLRSLNWIYGYVHNYGWSIVLLTAIINVIIFPLRHKSVVSMRKMQEIQPEAKAIQDRYAKLKATDPAKQKMNQEVMELYKQRNVNPASGCIPMLLPFPLLLAFYSLLTTAIELRGAPFVLWIHDLSAPDPYYVFPILMGMSQLWQQWIMPSAGVDPNQRRIGMIMPIVFMFLFINYPSGMAIYFLVTNVWAIGQQYFTNYLIGPPNIRTVRPPAERRAKRVGAGKTDAAAGGRTEHA